MNDDPLSKQIVDLLNYAIAKDKRIAELEEFINRVLPDYVKRIAELEEFIGKKDIELLEWKKKKLLEKGKE